MKAQAFGVFACVGLWACAGSQPAPSTSTAPPPPAIASGPTAPAPTSSAPGEVTIAEPGTPEALEEAAVDPGPISAGGWATFHGDPRRTGASAAEPIRQPRIRWKTKVGIQGWLNAPLALGSVAIVPSSGTQHNASDASDGVYALDMQTGRRVWHAKTGGDANGVLATDDRVVVTSDDGSAYAFALRTGKSLWKQAGNGKLYSHPLRVGDRVIVGDANGNLRALSLADGKPLWSVKLAGEIRGGAAADDSAIYAVSQAGDAIALRPDGKQIWKQQVARPAFGGSGRTEPIQAYSPPIVTRDLVIVPFARDTYYQDEPAILALDKRSGRVRWRARGPGQWGNVRSTPALVNGLLIWGEPYSGDVAAIRETTGRMAYRKTIGPCYFPQWASPAAAGEVVYLPRFDGSVYALRAKDGTTLWELYLGDSQSAGKRKAPPPGGRYGCEWDLPSGKPLYAPAAVAEDGTLLVGSAEGFLYAIDGR